MRRLLSAILAASALILAGPAVRSAEPKAAPDAQAKPDAGNYVRALWLVQRFGTDETADFRNDLHTKGALAKALGKDGALTAKGAKTLMNDGKFSTLAGSDNVLDPSEVKRALDADVPASRRRLLPAVAAHAEALTTSFDRIDETHREAGEALADWIAAHYKMGQPLNVIVVCTGNSRRSVLGATLGNVAAAYCGLPEVRFFSGGTAPTACNPRTVAALKAIGVEVEATGKEAPRGEPATANPIYRIRWGAPSASSEVAMEATEFSKKYSDPTNPQKGFAALMVCGEADAACPTVPGAAKRVSMPYLDPKVYDGSVYESDKYAERRDDMGRFMLAAMMRARHKLESNTLKD